MKCAWYQRWLIASADDELSGWRDALLRRHLAGCVRCATELVELRRVRELVAGQKTHYVAELDDQFFWQRLRPQLETPPQAESDGELVMAYSCRQKKELREPAGVAFFGVFSARRLAWGAVVVGLLVVTLIGIHLTRTPKTNQLAVDIPLLPPPGQSCVHFTEVESTKGTWASVVKFDKPDVDIAVIWVDGLPDMGKDLKPANDEL